jgi:HD-like signal output (HDOD) protein
MITILTIIHDPKQSVVLRQIFLKLHIKIINSQPTYGSYLKALQYDPDIIIMELPADPKAHLKFLSAIRCNKAIGQKPFILFGPSFDETTNKVISASGASKYLTLPLDLKKLFEEIRVLIHSHSIKNQPSQDKNQLTTDERAKLFDKSVAKEPKLEIMRKHIGKLLAFPATVASILQVTQNDRSGAMELAQVLKSDPAVSAEVLRIGNSVYYSRNGGKRILSVKDAVVRIGFTETKNIAMSLSVFKVLGDKNYETGFSHNEFWFHCLATASIAEQIAKNSQLASPEEAFIGGLLHDLGTLLFNEYFNDLFLALLDKTTCEGVRFLQLQNDILGFNHNDLMAILFQEWKFPETFCGDLRFIGSPEAFTKDFLQKRPLSSIINIAEVIAKCYQIGQEADCCVNSIPNEVFERLRMPFGIQIAFLERICNEMNMFNSLLKIFKGTFPLNRKLISDADKVNILCHSFGREVFSPVVEYLKSQGYNVNFTTDLKDFSTKGMQYHAFLLTDGQGAVLGDINEIANKSTLAFTLNKSTETNEGTSGKSTKSKVMVFDIKNDLNGPFPEKNIVVSRYPVDLRNVDMVLACMLRDQSKKPDLNVYGSFKSVNKLALDGKQAEIHVLIAHAKSQVRNKIIKLLNNQKHCIVEDTDDGIKAINLARTKSGEISVIVLQLNIPLAQCKDVVEQIKGLPTHKRAKYLICMENSTTKEQLIPLVKLGIRSFIKEEADDKEFSLMLAKLGLIADG